MRALVLILVVGCSSIPEQQVPTFDIACTMTVDDYCASNDCDRAFDTALHDSNLCPSVRLTCNGYDVIHLTPIDGDSTYYYLDGSLVAFHLETFVGGGCVAGPPTFSEPECDFNDAQTLCDLN